MMPSPQKITPGWGVAVEGASIDLSEWGAALKQPFDPWIEIHGAETILRSAYFDDLTEAADVHARASALIDRLNGAMALWREARPVGAGSVVQFKNGLMQRAIFVEPATYEIRGGAGVLTVSATHSAEASKPQPTDVQKWDGLAQDDDFLNDALVYYGKATNSNWFDIYKTLETIEVKFGGQEKFRALGWAPKEDIARLKRTANWARHAKKKFPPPTDPMDFETARALLALLLRRALSETSTG
jgi:hypothetical protein